MIPSAPSQTGDDDVLAEVIEEFTNRVQAGERVEVESYVRKHPEYAERLRQLLPALAVLAEVGRPASSPSDGLAASPGESLAGVLGDFRIVREVGRGGMGVVYEAEQVSLGRRVALKVLPFAATMDPRHLRRFHNEARAAASVHHSNIVPVYFVGCERGVHFYAMQFIDGQPLSELIRQLSGHASDTATTPSPAAAVTPLTGDGCRSRDYFRRAAELGVQAAEALDHAHQLGIVHRDIKPGNLLLDGTGRLWVMDFGLAHVRDGEANLTGMGQALGTPRYMSPEQALAKRAPVDHRTDVYSLGATLYELLTLRPAFDSEDRQELLRQIAFEEPARPRRLERAIPAELEIIVQKAMEKRPQDRYATAQELADDLQRWLKCEPIRARRPSPLARAAKWGRRHKPVMAASAAAVLMALLLAGYVAWTRHDRVVRRAASEKMVLAALKDSHDWQEQRRLPEALSAARRANGLLAGVDVDETLRQRIQARLADLELLDRLEDVRLEKGTAVKDGHLDDEGADAQYGQAFHDAGLDVEALPVEAAAERLRASTVAAELAAVLDHWAALRRKIKGVDDPSWRDLLRVAREADPDPWRMHLREALERRDWPALRQATAAQEVFQLPPATLSVLGSALLNDPEARGSLEAFLRAAQRRYPDDFWLNNNLWHFFTSQKPPRGEEAVRFAGAAAALRPRSPGAHLNLGNALLQKGDPDEAIAEYREALRLQKDYAIAYHNLGRAFYEKGQLAEAIAAYREAVHLRQDFPAAHNNLGGALHKRGQLTEAIAAYRDAIRLKQNFAQAHNNLGAALRGTGQLDEAIAECQEAIRINKDYASAHYNLAVALLVAGRLDESIVSFRETLRLNSGDADAHCNLGNALQRQGKLDEAIAAYREALRRRKNFPEVHVNLGGALQRKGQWKEAIAECREAVRIDKNFAAGHYDLGHLLALQGRVDEAIAAYRKAIRINKDYAEAHCDLGQMLLRKGQFAEALVHCRRGHELGSRDPRWPYPSAVWVRNCERWLELDGKLPAILSGQKQPADTEECLRLASLCQNYKHWLAAATRFHRAAFAEKPQLADNLLSQHRYNAACVAALAGCGQGEDAGQLDPGARARLRQQALDWLRDDLKAYRQMLDKFPDRTDAEIAGRLRWWLQDVDFAGVRGPGALAQLPEDERPLWQKLWRDVEALRQRAAGPPAARPARP